MSDGHLEEDVKEKAIECPKCGSPMVEVPQENMTNGQESDYFAGFNHPYACQNPDCNYHTLFDVGFSEAFGWEDPDIDPLVNITRIDPNSFEDVIEHALRSRCFIEAISLIHNVIEAYLKKKIEDLTNNDNERLELLKKKFNPRYLRDYTTISYLLGIIDKQTYKLILEFNRKRNKVIHELLINPKDISQIKGIARTGREIQMKLSPLDHSQSEINNIMATFDEIT